MRPAPLYRASTLAPFSISKVALPGSTCGVVLGALGCGLSLCVEALGGRASGGRRYLLLIHLGPCGPGMAVVTMSCVDQKARLPTKTRLQKTFRAAGHTNRLGSHRGGGGR